MANHGSGTYKIIGDTLRLSFDDMPAKTSTKISATKREELKDSIILNLKIIEDQTHEPIQFCGIAIFKKGMLYSGKETNKDGESQIRLKKDEGEYKFVLNHSGFESYEFRSRKSGIYDIDIKLGRKWSNQLIGGILDYQILELNDSIFQYKYFDDDLRQYLLYRNN